MDALNKVVLVIQKMATGQLLSGEEFLLLEDWKNQSAANNVLLNRLEDPATFQEMLQRYHNIEKNREHNKQRGLSIISQNAVSKSQSPRPVHRIHFLRTAWVRYAAAIILILGIGAYLYISQKQSPMPDVVSSVPKRDVPAPSSTHATLTLAGGQQILLDSAANGTLAVQGNVDIQKMNDGRIVYNGKQKSGAIQYNTVSVPRGSQIASIVLTDGSKVFLNSASSIRYPVAFTGHERSVEITGEVYFEIAKDPSRKFSVRSRGVTTEVLGTHFNVNAYPDEVSRKITLIEGRVKVTANNENVILKPGQQAELAENNQLQTNENVNISQVVAWQKECSYSVKWI